MARLKIKAKNIFPAQSSFIVPISFAFVIMTAVLVSGCYTVLMLPEPSGHQLKAAAAQSESGYGSDLNYHQSCTNCHSEAELEDRYYDMRRAGMYTAHGQSIDPYGWRNPRASEPWWTPISVGVPLPPPSAAGVSPSSSTKEENRRRISGSTRGEDQNRSRNPEPTNASSPPSTSGGTVQTPTTPPSGAGTVQKPPATQQDRGRSQDSSNSSVPSKRRTDGSTRGDEKDR